MRSKYFFDYHLKDMIICEFSAINNWTEMMRRGVRAYADCRMDTAEICLGSAVDIAKLRFTCTANWVFCPMHLLKPAEFLVQVMLSETRKEDVHIFLSSLLSFSRGQHVDTSVRSCVSEFLRGQ